MERKMFDKDREETSKKRRKVGDEVSLLKDLGLPANEIYEAMVLQMVLQELIEQYSVAGLEGIGLNPLAILIATGYWIG